MKLLGAMGIVIPKKNQEASVRKLLTPITLLESTFHYIEISVKQKLSTVMVMEKLNLKAKSKRNGIKLGVEVGMEKLNYQEFKVSSALLVRAKCTKAYDTKETRLGAFI